MSESKVVTSYEKKVGFEDVSIKAAQTEINGDVEFILECKAWVNDAKSWPESILFPAKFYGVVSVQDLVESYILKQGLVVSRLRDVVRKEKFQAAKAIAGNVFLVHTNAKRDRTPAITPQSTIKRLKGMGLDKATILALVESEFE